MAGWLALLCRLFLAMTFAVAAAGKLRTRAAAARALATLLPSAAKAGTAALAGMVVIEAAIVVALLASATIGAWLALGFTVAATGMLVGVLVRGRPAQCLCFGGEPHALSWLDVVRNAVLGAACAIVLLAPGPSGATMVEIVLLSGVAAIGLLLATGLSRIAAAFR